MRSGSVVNGLSILVTMIQQRLADLGFGSLRSIVGFAEEHSFLRLTFLRVGCDA